MNAESILQRLAVSMVPRNAARTRVRGHVFARIGAPQAMPRACAALAPSSAVRQRIWQRIVHAMQPQGVTVLERVHAALTPPQGLQHYLHQQFKFRLVPQPSVSFAYVCTKWVASLVLVGVLVRLSPALLVTDTTIAESHAVVLPTRGAVSITLDGGNWQDLQFEKELQEGMRIRTHDGEASLLLRDEVVVRLAPDSLVVVHTVDREDTSERTASLSVIAGRVWVQGLLSPTAAGLTIAIPHGNVTVQEGSLSLETQEDGSTAVRVWDRRAVVTQNTEEMILVVGEQVTVRDGNVLLLKKIPDSWFTQDWAKENLAKDAVHRQYIAHLQHERRAAAAGILPTSRFYSVKRVAEEMDVLLTLSEGARLQKRLAQANARLNEAAALLAEGQQADEVLEEYKQALFALATAGSGSDIATQMLLQQSLQATIAQVTAALPGDEGYSIKRAVLEASADVPGMATGSGAVRVVLLADALSQLSSASSTGDAAALQQAWIHVQPYVAYLDDESFDADIRKETSQQLQDFAKAVRKHRDAVAAIDPELIDDVAPYLPVHPEPVVVQLSAEDIAAIAQRILGRIYVYSMLQSQENQLQMELRALRQHNEAGRLLRALYHALSDESHLRDQVRRAIIDLRWQLAAERYEQEVAAAEAQSQSGSGGVLVEE